MNHSKSSFLSRISAATKRHKKETATLLTLFIFVAIMGVTCAFNVTKNIEVVVDHKTADQGTAVETKTISASLMTPVEEVLANEGVDTSSADYTVDTDVSKMVKDVDVVNVSKKVQGNIVVDGQTIPYDTPADTVGAVLTEQGITADENDEVTPSVDTQMSTDVTTINVCRVDVREESREEQIAFPVQSQENDQLDANTQNIITPGVNGLQTVVDQVTYRDGVEVGRNNISTAVISQPVTQVVEVGTKLAGGGSIKNGNRTEDPGSNMDMIAAIVAQEGGHTYEGALAVISCVMNRADTGAWGGTTAMSVLTAPGQFAAYLDGDYAKYIGQPLPEVRRAVTDCMVNGVRSHSYLCFRSYQTSNSVQIADGNWYFNDN